MNGQGSFPETINGLLELLEKQDEIINCFARLTARQDAIIDMAEADLNCIPDDLIRKSYKAELKKLISEYEASKEGYL